jgi:Holliday junction resolvase
LGKRVEALESRQTSIELSPLNVANLLELAKNQSASGNFIGVRLTQERIALIEPNSTALKEIEVLLQELP